MLWYNAKVTYRGQETTMIITGRSKKNAVRNVLLEYPKSTHIRIKLEELGTTKELLKDLREKK